MSRYAGFFGPYAAAFGNAVAARYPLDCPSPEALAGVTGTLLDAGWAEVDIRALLGTNLLRVLGQIWGS